MARSGSTGRGAEGDVFTVRFPEPLPAERRGSHWWVDAGGRRVRLSNLGKVWWPAEGITKGDLLAYYWNVAPTVLPYLADRPLTLKRMPDGIDGASFYQKDAPAGTPRWMTRCAIEPEDGDVDEMLVAGTAEDLLFIGNLGCIELHPLHSRCERYDLPDYLVVDLDPMPPAGFAESLEVARHVKVLLDGLGLSGYPKTSGATGVQVYVPVDPKHSYDETRAVAERMGGMLVDVAPELVTMDWSVGRRGGRVFFDHKMNRRAASLAAAYSVRAQPGATVSAPLTWAEVAAGAVVPQAFTIATVFGRLEAAGDVFAGVARPGQDLDPVLDRLRVRHTRGDASQGRMRRMLRPAGG